MPSQVKATLTKEKETLFITLLAKALHYHSAHSILNDAKADEITKQVDYDFRKLRSANDGGIGVVRARHIDEWVRQFLSIRPNAVVVHLGCGLDARVVRINPPSSVAWFDVDFPDVIQLRKHFFSNSESYSMIESSITIPEWLEAIPSNRPTLIVAEGVLEYLTEEEVRQLLNRLLNHFAEGEMIFDVMNSLAVKVGSRDITQSTGAVPKWGVEDIAEIAKLNPKLRLSESVALMRSGLVRRLPFLYRIFYFVASPVPKIRNMLRLLRYQFLGGE
jgi:O-methyltransferase involved in polyketide biosynthesis